MKVDSKLSGQRKEKEKEKVLCLVANGRRRRRFFAWWPMEGEGEGSLLGVQWKEKEKVLCLVANGRRRRRFFAWWPMEGEREGSFSTSSHFPPKQLYLDLRFFPLTLRFYFTMVIGYYLRIPSLFLGL